MPFSLQDLRDVLVRCGGLPASTVLDDPSLRLQDLGVDSACLLAVRAHLRTQFGLDLDVQDMKYFETIGGGVEYVNRRLEASES